MTWQQKQQEKADKALARAFNDPTPGEKVEVRGEVDFVRVVNERSGWGFAKLYVVSAEGKGVLVPIVGIVADLYDTAVAIAVGSWKRHQRYGLQVETQYVHVELPNTASGVAAWLEDRFPDIGPVRSRAIVSAFPPPLLWQVLAEEPKRLAEVEGIGEKLALACAQAYEIHKYEREAFVSLADMGLKSEQIRSAIRLWRGKAVEVLQANPFELRRLPGVTWKQTDAIAFRQGVRRDDTRRLVEGLRYAAEVLERQGHTCQIDKKLIVEASGSDILGVPTSQVDKAFDVAWTQGALVEGPTGAFYRPETAAAEERIAKTVLDFLNLGEK